MPSDVEIANRALQKLGEARISSLEDNIKAAREMKAAYSIVRNAELRAHRWNFAIKRVSLPALSSVPAHTFNQEFQLPSDCLRVLEVGNVRLDLGGIDYRTGMESLFQIEGRKILSDLSAPLPIRYVYEVTDSGQFDACFVDSFACRLAIETCEALTQSTSKKQEIKRDYMRSIRAAKLTDAIENPPEGLAASTLELARL